MATFHGFDPLAVWGFLTSGRYARCPPGRTLVAEGAPSAACYLTINGAVEKVMVRGDRRIRVGAGGAGEGVRLRGPDRRRRFPFHRDLSRAGTPAGAAPRSVRTPVPRGGCRCPGLPRRDPARSGGVLAPDIAPARAAGGERVTAQASRTDPIPRPAVGFGRSSWRVRGPRRPVDCARRDPRSGHGPGGRCRQLPCRAVRERGGQGRGSRFCGVRRGPRLEFAAANDLKSPS